MDIRNRLIEGNANFCEKIGKNPAKTTYFANLINGQHPYALVVCCSDSRVVPEEIFSAQPGELFVIRTAGNVINEGELASIEYGIEHLHIEYALVLGHTNCGAVHASIHNERGKYLSSIISNIRKSIVGIVDETEASITNAKAQTDYLKSKFPDAKCEFAYGIYYLENNKVELK